MPFPHPTGNEGPSYWTETTPQTAYPRVEQDERADVVVVGGGIVGLLTAYLAAKDGRSVVVVDRERVAMAETGHTTAHLQIVIDTRLTDLVPRFGLERTKLAWDSQLEAVRLIEAIAAEERIACELERLDAYLYSPSAKDKDMLKEEVRLARQMGYEAHEASPDDVPYPAKAVLLFPDQGKFHVRKFLLGVAKAAERRGVRIFEGTEVASIQDGVATTREGHKLTGEWVVHATNVPFEPRVLLQTKLYAYRTYAIGARVPRGTFGNALYWDTNDPYHYTRVEHEADGDLVILGGEDHKVGIETDTPKHHGALADYLRTATKEFEVLHKWSGEVLETQDDLPYIGHLPGGSKRDLVATGDSGTGMTNGAIAALMLSERIAGRGTPWDELYDPRRVTGDSTPLMQYAKQRAHETMEYARAALRKGDVASVMDIAPGEGGVVRKGVKPIAVYRREDGRLVACSATCTHLGCTVRWNKLESSWDCACHGSRFSPTGDVLHGPAPDPLPRVDVDDVFDAREAAMRSTEGP